MLWNVTIDPTQDDQLSKSVTVEADSWHAALCSGLKEQGTNNIVLANLNCKTSSDQSITIQDSVTRRTFRLRPFEPSVIKENVMDSLQIELMNHKRTHRNMGSRHSEMTSIQLSDLPKHEIFFEKDDKPDDNGGVFYRERRIVAKDEFDKESVTHLVTKHFEALRSLNGYKTDQLFVSIAIFDHVFDDRQKRPPIAALTYKSWKENEPVIIYPLSGDKGVVFGKPTPSITLKNSKWKKPSKTHVRRKDDTVLERIISAFENMQGIFPITDHDKAASFVLELARKLIPCEAGECLLVSPKRYVLYVSAISGTMPKSRLNKRISMTDGVIGFADKNSAVLSINDTANDTRYNSNVDAKEDFETQNVLIAPMQFEGETVGVIELLNTQNEDGFSEMDANILSYLGASFAEFATISLPSRQARFTDRDFTYSPTEITTTALKQKKRNKPVKKRVAKPAASLKSSSKTKQQSSNTKQPLDNTSKRKTIKVVAPVGKKRKFR